MRLPIARASADGHTQAAPGNPQGDIRCDVRSTHGRAVALVLAVVLILGSVGILVGSSKPAGAATPLFASGQVFASVGNSAVSVYSQGSGQPPRHSTERRVAGALHRRQCL